MKELISPANLITVTGSVLTVIGCIAYLTGSANLSVPTLFYGFPIFLGGLALKSTEIKPAKRIVPAELFSEARKKAPEELTKLVSDVTRWRYGQHAHLESSLKVLNLWDQANPPQLIEIEEMETNSGYSLRLRFLIAGVSIERWKEKEERLSRFFAKGLKAELISNNPKEIDLMLLHNKEI
tara:strand:+ start:653 stop:1195 length:543 start_codon:yes stop_codon:yes gene_type:complete